VLASGLRTVVSSSGVTRGLSQGGKA